MTRAHIKYYGTLAATLFVLLLSTNRIASALGVVEQRFINDNDIYLSAWMAAAGLQVFEVLAGIGIADILSRRKKDRSAIVMLLLILFLLCLFTTNLIGNLLFTYANMAGKDGHILLMADLDKLDILKKYWVWWGSVPVPLMGVIGVTVQAIFSKDLPKKTVAKDEKGNKTMSMKVGEILMRENPFKPEAIILDEQKDKDAIDKIKQGGVIPEGADYKVPETPEPSKLPVTEPATPSVKETYFK